MNTLVGQRLWKWKLVAGLLTIVVGAIVLAWPGPSILVASTLFGVYLLVSGLAELFMAFTLPRSAATRVMLFMHDARVWQTYRTQSLGCLPNASQAGRQNPLDPLCFATQAREQSRSLDRRRERR